LVSWIRAFAILSRVSNLGIAVLVEESQGNEVRTGTILCVYSSTLLVTTSSKSRVIFLMATWRVADIEIEMMCGLKRGDLQSNESAATELDHW
jgi:hypothetical protein